MNINIEALYNLDMEAIEVANHPMEELYLKVSSHVSANDMARKVRK